MICDSPSDPNPDCEKCYNILGQQVLCGDTTQAFGWYFSTDNGITIGQSPTGGFNQLEACQPNTAFLNEYFISSDYTTLLKMALIVIFVFLLYLIF